VEKKGDFFTHKGNMIVYINDKYIGDCDMFLEWALQNFKYVDNTNLLIYKKMAAKHIKDQINNTKGRSYAYMNIKQATSTLEEQIVFELFEDQCPNTCANFIKLCEGFKRKDGKTLTYKGAEVNRVVKGMFICAGNIRENAGK
jgi:hypothetical protein